MLAVAQTEAKNDSEEQEEEEEEEEEYKLEVDQEELERKLKDDAKQRELAGLPPLEEKDKHLWTYALCMEGHKMIYMNAPYHLVDKGFKRK